MTTNVHVTFFPPTNSLWKIPVWNISPFSQSAYLFVLFFLFILSGSSGIQMINFHSTSEFPALLNGVYSSCVNARPVLTQLTSLSDVCQLQRGTVHLWWLFEYHFLGGGREGGGGSCVAACLPREQKLQQLVANRAGLTIG